MITHSCIPNSGHFENMNEGSLEVVSLVDIPKDAPITMCYDWCLKVKFAMLHQHHIATIRFLRHMLEQYCLRSDGC